MRVQVEIRSCREADGQKEESTVLENGELTTTEQGHRITYCNTAEGMEDVLSTLMVSPRRVVIENSGAMRSCLTVELGKTHRCEYDTGYGLLTLETAARQIDNRLNEFPKTLFFVYDLKINGGEAARHTLQLTLRPTI